MGGGKSRSLRPKFVDAKSFCCLKNLMTSVPQTINLINSVAMSSVSRNNINYSLLFMKYKSLTENRGSGFLSTRKMSSYCKYHVKPFSNLHIQILQHVHVLRSLKAVCVMLSLVIDLQESHCLAKRCSPLG